MQKKYLLIAGEYWYLRWYKTIYGIRTDTVGTIEKFKIEAVYDDVPYVKNSFGRLKPVSQECIIGKVPTSWFWKMFGYK